MKKSMDSISPKNSHSKLFSTCIEVRKLSAFPAALANPLETINADLNDPEKWRRHCGCLKTSEKLKKILESFPGPPPPSPLIATEPANLMLENTCISAYCTGMHQTILPPTEENRESSVADVPPPNTVSHKAKGLLSDVVQFVQLSVTATALALYYIIYGYMQLVYYLLRSAIFFHRADGPMKITIGVVTLTSLVVGFNLLMRLERLAGVLLR